MKIDRKALTELRGLLVTARELAGFASECERTHSGNIRPTEFMGYVMIDVGYLGLEAFVVSEDDVFEWRDGFEGILYALCRSVDDAIDRPYSDKQRELLEELKGVIISIDRWHTKYVAD
jgi:hypothetical protein